MPAAVAFLPMMEMATPSASTLSFITSFLFKHHSFSISIYLTIYLRLSERKLDATLFSMLAGKQSARSRL
jgi:hypothetical protein